MLIQRASLLDGRIADIRVGEAIEEVGPSLRARRGEAVLDAALGAVIPGLHDHHVHVYSAAAEQSSLRVGPREAHDTGELRRLLAGAAPGADGWIRAIGYHEQVAGPLDRDRLDALAPAVPVRVQHRSGVLWVLNSAGLAAINRPDHPDGILRSADPTWAEALPRRDADIDSYAERLARYGVTGVTDATPDLSEPPRGLPQHLHVLAPGKKILHDDTLDLDGLVTWIGERHARGVPVAVHCVTSAQLVVTIAAMRVTGVLPGDRIEHAAMVPEDCVRDLCELGVTVVTQPNFVTERGDAYRSDVDAADHHQLWRVATLLAAGVRVALSTDAPFGDADPWAVMRAAVHRRTPHGFVLNPAERIPARTALELFFGTAQDPAHPRRVDVGQPGDLCVLAAPPRHVVETLDADLVAATIIGGSVVFSR
ncbi:amidohydrolase family protein [Mycolicibacterium smegmatis]|uniref:Amidohydrolase 3 n=1 Tax=Mycolicibacterium smegmatis (strain MKD8) TaxID=1214915 RepID=A0A2U9PHS0_MYCSE|nr:amidohydrolase family protein [Mycolicibacterium smegmatis]AWT51269.1 amidohydrolase 3 [Mycolicibacterium smegmatis MKD8]